MSPGPLASLIIPTRNRPGPLDSCLGILSPQIPADGSVELIICDGSPGDETRQMLEKKHPSARWIRGPRRGPGANRNTGAESANGEWLIFLDDDCVPHPGFLGAYLDTIRTRSADGARVLTGSTLSGPEVSRSLLWESPHFTGGTGLPPSCNFAIQRKLFLASGGFDERFLISFEDMEFFDRLVRSGETFSHVGTAAADHPARPLPPPSTLADRWEARVISTFDLGASPSAILRFLPRHVAAVILSRFRDRKTCSDKARAATVFLGEFLLVLWRLPGWLKKHGDGPRSAFWADQVRAGKCPRRFGL